MRILKYQLAFTDVQFVDVPKESAILKVGIQGDTLTMWAAVPDDNSETVSRRFFVIGTGHYFDHSGKNYIDTVFHGAFVWHIFEGVPKP